MGKPRGREQVVPGKPHHAVLVAQGVATAGQDGLDQVDDAGLGHPIAQAVEQDRMIDRCEMLADVSAQHVATATGKLLQAVDGAVRAFAHPVGIAVRDEYPLEPRLDNGA